MSVAGLKGCDLVIGRYSYPLVEIGCVGHGGGPAQAARSFGSSCWSEKRLAPLDYELRMSEIDPEFPVKRETMIEGIIRILNDQKLPTIEAIGFAVEEYVRHHLEMQ